MGKKQTHLYIDGQNFIARIRSILRRRGTQEPDIVQFDFWGLLNHVFQTQDVDLASFYGARVLPHRETEEKSTELVKRQEELQRHLEQQGFRYVMSGTVRARGRGEDVTFEEKGVDVRIAIDMVTDALLHSVDTVILGSSDSDLQPAVAELKSLGIRVIYLGFRTRPTHGLRKTTDQTILIHNDDVARFYSEKSAEQHARQSRRNA